MAARRPDTSERGEQTRTRIVDAALGLFEERGYEGTTMRAVAAAAGVSLGNAYYYFASKDHLVQAFYERSQVEHLAASRPVLDRERDLGARLSGVLHAWLDTNRRYHDFAVTFFRTAADPDSPLSPFSPQSQPARDAAIALYAEVLHGSDAKVTPAVRERLPEMLWLYSMGVVLYWVHDRSTDVERSRFLVDRTVPLVVRLVNLSRYRVLRGVVDDAMDIVDELSGRRLTR
ncbi:MAG TPA: TetR family transcriptional regulator [Mycobacteriales bacterium]|nr:TetR family transcriptional regulator [Mycobacteriales bacterium]